MKKFLFIPLLSLLLAACNTNQGDGKQGNNDNASTEEQAQTKPAGEEAAAEASQPVVINEDQFAQKVFNFRSGGQWKYTGDKPCIVDFYADWCAPCRIIGPYMKEIAELYKGKIYVYKVDTDKAQNLSGYLGIKGIPSVMFCPMEGNYQMVVGAQPKEEYISLIQSVLKVN